MRIGTDCSLMVCLREGYTVIDFKVRELFPNGRKAGMDKDCFVRFSASYPEYQRKEFASAIDPFGMARAFDTFASWNYLMGIYEKRNEAIDSFVDFTNCPLNWDSPTQYDLLQLGDAVQGYCGID